MSGMDWLPNELSMESYISLCLKLIDEWKWLILERNTDVLKAGILDKPPASNFIPIISALSTEHLNEVPHGFVEDDWPDEMKNFIKQCSSLRLTITNLDIKCDINIDFNSFRKMSPKKQEEVMKLSAMTAEMCEKYNIKHVIDFGSGLGYVDRILHKFYGLSVLGLEKDAEKISKAMKLGNGVDYKECFLSNETIPEVKKTIKAWLQGSSVCFIALHGCGDLSILIGRLFSEMDEGKLLILVPCCYHRSTMRPLNHLMKECGLVNTNLLRIASDSTAERWQSLSPQQHLAHARSMLARALIQLYPTDDATDIKKKQRHLLRAVSREDWDKCFEKCVEGFTGVNTEKLKESWKNNEWRFDQIEAYTCLQVCLQGVAEGLVIADTFLFLLEETKANINLIRIFDVFTSPRSIAFVVTR